MAQHRGDQRFAQAKYDAGWLALGSERDMQDRRAAAYERKLFDDVMASVRLYPDADDAPRHVSRHRFPTPREVLGDEPRYVESSTEDTTEDTTEDDTAMEEGF